MLFPVALVCVLSTAFAWAPPSKVVSRLQPLRASATKNADEFTIVGADGKRTSLSKEEKERIFIDAIQSYYFSGRQVLSDTDFDLLKEDLAWEGSEYAVLSRNETKFLGAMGAYAQGDAEADEEDHEMRLGGLVMR